MSHRAITWQGAHLLGGDKLVLGPNVFPPNTAPKDIRVRSEEWEDWVVKLQIFNPPSIVNTQFRVTYRLTENYQQASFVDSAPSQATGLGFEFMPMPWVGICFEAHGAEVFLEMQRNALGAAPDLTIMASIMPGLVRHNERSVSLPVGATNTFPIYRQAETFFVTAQNAVGDVIDFLAPNGLLVIQTITLTANNQSKIGIPPDAGFINYTNTAGPVNKLVTLTYKIAR